MDIVTSSEHWNQTVCLYGPRSGAFLQSWEWGEVQKSLGEEVTRYKTAEAQAQVATKSLPAGMRYTYIARGPVGESAKAESDIAKLITQDRKDDLFMRIDGNREIELKVKKVRDVQPSTTFITDLSVDLDEMVAQLHHKTRYNIRLAKRKGVEVHLNAVEHFDDFVRLMKIMSVRQDIRSHGKKHFKKTLEHLNGDGVTAPRAFLAVATHEGDVLAANMMIDFSGTRTYLHGASSNDKRNLMAPHLLQWSLIEDAKEKGLAHYDWWGIAPKGAKNHPWSGVTRFKKGFVGEVVSLPGTVDLINKPLIYNLYKLARKILRGR